MVARTNVKEKVDIAVLQTRLEIMNTETNKAIGGLINDFAELRTEVKLAKWLGIGIAILAMLQIAVPVITKIYFK